MTLSSKSLAGPGYIILNGIRVMNIVAFLAVIAASIVMLVKTSVASKFFFFDAVTHVLTAITSSKCCHYEGQTWTLLTITQCSSCFKNSRSFVASTLATGHCSVRLTASFTLALAMVVLGINMLGNLNKEALSQESLGLAFWRVVISAGIIIFIMGWINLVASYVFRDRSQGVTARQVRAHGAVAVHKSPMSQSAHGTPSAPELAQSYIKSPFHSD